jgi:hypothetical protein
VAPVANSPTPTKTAAVVIAVLPEVTKNGQF